MFKYFNLLINFLNIYKFYIKKAMNYKIINLSIFNDLININKCFNI